MKQSNTQAATRRGPPLGGHLITLICWTGLFAEGYDVGVLGAILPALLADPAWHLTPVQVGFLASAALFGMFVGGFLIGTLSDIYGKRTAFLTCLALFSLSMGAAALSPTPQWFAFFRFISGVGIGGIIPIAAALTTEFAPPERRNRVFAWMYSGYSLGIFASALTAFMLSNHLDWRIIVGLGAVPVVLVPLYYVILPESPAFLVRRGRIEDATRVCLKYAVAFPAVEQKATLRLSWREAAKAILGKVNRRATAGFWLATFTGMILVYGLNTWLPNIMRSAGYELGPSILFLAVFALSSSAGGIVLGAIADRIGRAITIAGAFIVGGLAMASLSFHFSLPLTYVIVAIAGVGTVSAAVMVTSYLSSYFPPELRASAVGWCLSFSRFGAITGPVLGGAIAGMGLGVTWNFYIFAAAAVLAAISISIVPHKPEPSLANTSLRFQDLEK